MAAEPLLGYRALDVWQKAMTLVETVYKMTHELPDSERFGLVSQVQRSAVSVPCNVAEGYGRGGGTTEDMYSSRAGR